jgi:hypothetical protein
MWRDCNWYHFLVFITCFAFFLKLAINSYYRATVTSNLVTRVFLLTFIAKNSKRSIVHWIQGHTEPNRHCHRPSHNPHKQYCQLKMGNIKCHTLYYSIIILCSIFVFGDCSIEICVSLLYCIFVPFVCVSFFSDKFHVCLYNRICGPAKWYMIRYDKVCVYIYIYTYCYMYVTKHVSGLVSFF